MHFFFFIKTKQINKTLCGWCLSASLQYFLTVFLNIFVTTFRPVNTANYRRIQCFFTRISVYLQNKIQINIYFFYLDLWK